MLNLDGTKIAHEAHAERLRAFLAGERVAPITMDMALTQKCQMACRFCYADLQRHEADPVPWEIWEQFLEDCVTIGHKPGEGVKAISLVSDGESTLSKSYYKFIYKAKSLGIDVASGTNGEALKHEEMPRLLESLTYLRINFNAAGPEANAKIMGTSVRAHNRVVSNVRELVRLKKRYESPCTIGLQMVLMPHYGHEVVPLAQFGRELGVDYLVIKHCSDDEVGRIAKANPDFSYAWYRRPETIALLEEAESYSTDTYKVQVKWSKLKVGRDRGYTRCHGAWLHLQISGTGLIAPCGSFFHPRYTDKHIGSLMTARFKDIWASERYGQVLESLRQPGFNPQHDCATLCLQDKTNEALFAHIDRGFPLPVVLDRSHHHNFL